LSAVIICRKSNKYKTQPVWLKTKEVYLLTMYQKHIVQKGETLWGIAKAHGINLDDLIAANPQITDPNLIMPNNIINIPTAGNMEREENDTDQSNQTPPSSMPRPLIYIVRPGDTMYKIAAAFDMTLEDLIAANPHIADPNVIHPGNKLFIPKQKPPATPYVKPEHCPYAGQVTNCIWLRRSSFRCPHCGEKVFE